MAAESRKKTFTIALSVRLTKNKHLSVGYTRHSEITISLTKGNGQGTSGYLSVSAPWGGLGGFGSGADERGIHCQPEQILQYGMDKILCLSRLRQCHPQRWGHAGQLLRHHPAPIGGRGTGCGTYAYHRTRGGCLFSDHSSPYDQGPFHFLCRLCDHRLRPNGKILSGGKRRNTDAASGSGNHLLVLQPAWVVWKKVSPLRKRQRLFRFCLPYKYRPCGIFPLLKKMGKCAMILS